VYGIAVPKEKTTVLIPETELVLLKRTPLNRVCKSVGEIEPLIVKTPLDALYEVVTPVGKVVDTDKTSLVLKLEIMVTFAPFIVLVSFTTIALSTKTGVPVFAAFTVPDDPLNFGKETVNVKLVVVVEFDASDTDMVTIAVPVCPVAGVKVMVLLAPDPPNTIPEPGSKVVLDEAEVTIKLEAGVT